MSRTGIALVLLLSLSLIGCQSSGGNTPEEHILAAPRPLTSPAGPGSGEPHLALSPDGGLYLSWFEEHEDGAHRFRWSVLEEDEWSQAATIAEGDSFFVNWADFPTLVPLGDNRLIAHWPWKSGDDVYAYDVRIALSADGGKSWSDPITPHDDGTPTEHGFVSMVPEGEGARVIWLDGRNFAGKESHDGHGGAVNASPQMALRTASLDSEGRVVSAGVLDSRVCDCCQTSAVAVDGGVLIAYRDRSDTEVRDISLIRISADGTWGEPMQIGEDGWEISGCPVNGAALDEEGDLVAIAWYTGEGEEPRVQVALSSDAGRSFAAAVRVDEGAPLGRIDVVQLADGSALISWVEDSGDDALIRVRRVLPGGEIEGGITVARTSAARASGFPRMVKRGATVFFAWTEVGEPSRVRLATARLNSH